MDDMDVIKNATAELVSYGQFGRGAKANGKLLRHDVVSLRFGSLNLILGYADDGEPQVDFVTARDDGKTPELLAELTTTMGLNALKVVVAHLEQ